MKIVEIAFTAYPVTDLKRARAFYEQTLQLQAARVFGEGDHQWVEYDVGPATLAVTNMASDWKPSADGPSIAFEVENFEETVEQLKERNVPFRIGPFESPVCWTLVIADPDGNNIAMHKRHPKPAGASEG